MQTIPFAQHFYGYTFDVNRHAPKSSADCCVCQQFADFFARAATSSGPFPNASSWLEYVHQASLSVFVFVCVTHWFLRGCGGDDGCVD